MIFGEEGVGLTKKTLETADYAVEIPQFGSVRSLNVGTSSGIVILQLYFFFNSIFFFLATCLAVAGMSCISPIAFAEDNAFGLK